MDFKSYKFFEILLLTLGYINGNMIALTKSSCVDEVSVMEWKPVVGFESLYRVSDDGSIFSVSSQRILSARPMNAGYFLVQLWKHNRGYSFLVHRLVMAAFVGPCPDGHNVNHKNRNKLDNRLENLEYVTLADNNRHCWQIGTKPRRYQGREKHPNAKLFANDIIMIRNLFRDGIGIREIGRRFGISHTTVQFIRDRKAWAHVPDESAIEAP